MATLLPMAVLLIFSLGIMDNCCVGRMSGVIPYNPGAQELPYSVRQQEYQQAVQRAERVGYQLAAIRARRPVRQRIAAPPAPKPRLAVVASLMIVVLAAAVVAFLA